MADSLDPIVVRPRTRRRRALQIAAPTLLGAALAVTACGGTSSQAAPDSQPTGAPSDDVMSEDPGPVEDSMTDDAPADDAMTDDAPNDDPPSDDGAPEDDAPNDDPPSDDEG